MPIRVQRKVREIAGSLYICIPKYWADSVRLVKDDPVAIELTDDRTMKIVIVEVRPDE